MNLTASQLDRAELCAYPNNPGVLIARSESAAGAKGTEDHALISDTIEDPDAPDPETSATHARWLAEWWETERHTANWQTEVAIAMNPRTGEVMLVPQDATGHRDYSLVPEGFVCGTADGVAWDPATRTLRVVDWKTGQAAAYRRTRLVRGADGRLVAREVGWKRPSELGQLLFLGAAFARLYGAVRVSLELVLVNETRLHPVAELVSRLDLRLYEGVVAGILDATRLGQAPAVAGFWCAATYCPFNGFCPATEHAAAELLPAVRLSRFPPVLHSGDFESPEHAGHQLSLIAPAVARLQALRLAGLMYLKERGTAPAPGGGIWAMKPAKRDTIDINVPGAMDALRAALPSAWESAVTMKASASASSIYEAVKPGVLAAKVEAKAAGRPVKGFSYEAETQRVVETLRAAGAVKRSEWETPTVVPAGKERLPEASDGARDDAA